MSRVIMLMCDVTQWLKSWTWTWQAQ